MDGAVFQVPLRIHLARIALGGSKSSCNARWVSKNKKCQRRAGFLTHVRAHVLWTPVPFKLLRFFNENVTLVKENCHSGQRNETFTNDFCMKSCLFSKCLKLKLCGCSHSSLFFFLRHLLGDIDTAKSEGKFSMFFVCFFQLTTP